MRDTVHTMMIIILAAVFFALTIAIVLGIDTDEIRMPKDGFTVQDIRFDASKAQIVTSIRDDMDDSYTTGIVTQRAIAEALGGVTVTTPTLQQVIAEGNNTSDTAANWATTATVALDWDGYTTPGLASVLGAGNDAGGQDIAGVGDLYTTGTAWAQDVNTTGTVTAGGAALSTGTVAHTPTNTLDITNKQWVDNQFVTGTVTVSEGEERGPIHHYRMNDALEGRGALAVVQDQGIGATGVGTVDLASTVISDTWAVDGKINDAFDGDPAGVPVKNAMSPVFSHLRRTTIPVMTVAAWINVPSGNTNQFKRECLFGTRSSGNDSGRFLTFSIASGVLRIGPSTTASWDSFIPSDFGQWHHAVAVFGVSSTDFYINGIFQASYAASLDQDNTRILVAKRDATLNSDAAYRALIDDARIYDYALDSDAIDRLYADGLGTEDTITEGVDIPRTSTILATGGRDFTSMMAPGHVGELRTVIDGSPVLTATSQTVTAYRDLHTTGTLWAQDVNTTGTITATTVTATAFVGDGSAITGIYSGELWYALSCDDADVATYRYLKSNCDNTTTIATVLTEAPPGSTLVGQWITLEGSPGVRRIPAGVHEIALLASATVSGVSTSRIYATLSIYHPDTTETAIGTSELTPFLTATATQYKIYGILPEIELDVADRIIIKVYGDRGATGSDPTVSLVAGNSSHYAMPDFGASVERFVPYTGAINSVNLGTHSLYAQDVATTGGVTAATVTATGNVTGGALYTTGVGGVNVGGTGGLTVGAGGASVTGDVTLDGNATIGGDLIADTIHGVSDDGLVLALDMSTTAALGADTMLLDSSALANHGTTSGTTVLPTGGFNGGGAMQFDANNENVTITNQALHQVVAFWTSPYWSHPSGVARIWVDTGGTGDRVFFHYLTTGQTALDIGATVLRFTYPWVAGQWYFVVFDIPNRTVWINGVVAASSTAITYTPRDIIRIGSRNDGFSPANAIIDDFRIYNRALSADEIKGLYLQRAAVDPPRLSLVSPNEQTVWSDVRIEGALTADSYADNTPGWERSSADALSAILGLGYETRDGRLKIDHDTLPPEAQAIVGYRDVGTGEFETIAIESEPDADGKTETRYEQREITRSEPVLGRDLGALITIQSEAIKALEARLRALEPQPTPTPTPGEEERE